MPKRYRKQLGIFSLDVLNKKPKNPAISTSFGMSKIQLRFVFMFGISIEAKTTSLLSALVWTMF